MAEEAALEQALIQAYLQGGTTVSQPRADGAPAKKGQFQIPELPAGTEQRAGTLVIDIFILIIIVVIGFIAAIMLAIAAAAITKINPNWRDDMELSRAHRLMSWATAILWIGGALLILFYLFFFWFLTPAYNYVLGFTEVFVTVVFIAASVMAFIAVAEVRKSSLFSEDNAEAKRAVTFGTIAGVTAVISSIGLIIWIIYSFIQFERQGGVAGDIKFKAQIAEQVAQFAA